MDNTNLISTDTIHVWYSKIDKQSHFYKQLYTYLSKEELAKFQKLKLEKVKTRYIFSKGLTRYYLSKYTNKSPKDIVILHNEYGKPKCTLNKIEYNVSHSGNIIIHAFTKVNPIGIDIEYKKDINNYKTLAKRFFNEIEYNNIANTQINKQRDLFYKIWTAKESYIKFKGKGLFLDLKNFYIKYIDNKYFLIYKNNSKNIAGYGYKIELDLKYEISICSLRKKSQYSFKTII